MIRGVVALGESLAIGFRALAISANYAAQEEDEERRESQTRALARRSSSSRSRSRSASRFALFKVGAGADHRLLPIERHGWFVVVEGVIRVSIFIALPRR